MEGYPKNKIVPPDGGYGWIVVFACILINSSLAPLMQCFGIIYEDKFQRMKITAAEISFLLHLQNSIMCSLGLFTGPLLKKFTFRQIAMVGCTLVSLGILSTSFCTTYRQLIFTLGLLIGIGQGVLMPSTALAINSYFKKRLTIAMTFSVTGVGLLPIVMPHICHFLLEKYGMKGTVLLLAAGSFHSFIGVLLLQPLQKTRLPKLSMIPSTPINDTPKISIELVETPAVYKETTIVKNTSRQSAVKFLKLFDLKLLKERAYLIVVLGMAVSYVSELNIILMIPFVLSELANFSRADVALALSIQAGADILGRLILPIATHRLGWSSKIMYSVSLMGSSVGRTVLATFFEHRTIVLICAVVLGLFKGSKAVFQSLVLPEVVEFERLPTAMGFLMVTNGIISFIVGPIIGGIHDVTCSYVYAIHTATLMSVFCVIVWLVDSQIPSNKVGQPAVPEEENML